MSRILEAEDGPKGRPGDPPVEVVDGVPISLHVGSVSHTEKTGTKSTCSIHHQTADGPKKILYQAPAAGTDGGGQDAFALLGHCPRC